MNSKRDDEGDVGVFSFAKKSGVLLLPMGVVAGLFGLWLRSELASMKADFTQALIAHEHEARTERVGRSEYEMFRTLTEEKFKLLQHEQENQTKAILRNTVYLERIGQKLGITRQAD